MRVRTDSAGRAHGFVHGWRARNIDFAVVARSDASIHAVISRIDTIDDPRWQPVRRASGDVSFERALVPFGDVSRRFLSDTERGDR